MQLPSHTNALADQANAAGAAKHFAEGEEAARLEQLKEDRRNFAGNQELRDATLPSDDDLALIRWARAKNDLAQLGAIFNEIINRFLDDKVELEVADENARMAQESAEMFAEMKP